ncbi:MAG: leucyl aminopeptidase family protein [Sediminimonas qiaohouensis]|uniref:Leucyl aminopeptidase family protein n=1 Tax=Sediminimonas qiaohouensis TaxID=552061 RepID=A0A7C9HDS5_9RHOB|nr:leucyl aminopeptidase family protein [Sediminimonas qiaohouensis]MTJ06027.1 leucyl aminopeptidase family protein [Sediminimonas qiaohouensis]
MMPRFADPATADEALPLFLLEEGAVTEWAAQQADVARRWITASGFDGTLGRCLAVPGADGAPALALMGFGTQKKRARGRFHLAAAAAGLPAGTYRIAGGLPADEAEQEALGWLLASYRFDTYRGGDPKRSMPLLIAPEGVDAPRLEVLAEAECMIRDLINTPANDMGPDALEAACLDLAHTHGASLSVVRGEDLIEQNYPLIHAVGRASSRAPRLIDMHWGEEGPLLTLVGKGVCFDTGGLNLKPGTSMGSMKKDMGGAANVLGLAHMIMALGLPLRLRVLIPAVENCVSANSFRPGDILTSRAGLTVEINNTDAEGRLVLADALTCGAEGAPDLMISMATLTGAARVAMGPDIAPVFTDDDALAGALAQIAPQVADPVWRMPFWDPYEGDIEPGIADLDNAPNGGMGGAITAALFLRRFARAAPRYAHFDIYAWQAKAAPARPKGGLGQGPRALLGAIERVFDIA